MIDCRCSSVSASRQWRTRSASSRDSTVSATPSGGTGATVLTLRSRWVSALTERTRSTARRCAIVITQVIALPRLTSKRDAVRHTSSRTSCATSSDWAGSRTTLRIRP